ncbi:hypothetical protein CDL15_Pgr013331 [Punica granatum]|uniref:Potassium channel tetramerisation-type BTB domain-containing protein n=1 Tax=Punica granatum TaxID=22663 RepID=A0A218WNI6_PUNGR|nr:hypothetical protein CDL15_Pgr013331 [Punica granatum]
MLAKATSSSFFSALFKDKWNIQQYDTGIDEIFIDRKPECFGAFLDLLRIRELRIPGSIPKDFSTHKLYIMASRTTSRQQ